MINRIPELLARGCDISVNRGVLVVSHPTDPHYSSKWLRKYSNHLIYELSEILKIPIYQYIGYSARDFGKKDANGGFPNGRQSGVCLQFVDVVTGETYNAIFNASLERTRTTKSGKAGERLPKNRFIVQKRSSFVAFWRETGLAFSCYSEFYKRMGRLSNLCFTADTHPTKKKLVNKTIRPLNLVSEELQAHLSGKQEVSLRQESDKLVVSTSDNTMRQAEAISACDKENSTTLSSKEIERYSRCVKTLVRSNNSTCEKAALSKDYELSNQERTYKDDCSNSLNRKLPQEQTTDEWLADYDKAS